MGWYRKNGRGTEPVTIVIVLLLIFIAEKLIFNAVFTAEWNLWGCGSKFRPAFYFILFYFIFLIENWPSWHVVIAFFPPMDAFVKVDNLCQQAFKVDGDGFLLKALTEIGKYCKFYKKRE